MGLVLYCLQAPAEMTLVHKYQSLIFIYGNGELEPKQTPQGSGGTSAVSTGLGKERGTKRVM